jgi:hypothetical protein
MNRLRPTRPLLLVRRMKPACLHRRAPVRQRRDSVQILLTRMMEGSEPVVVGGCLYIFELPLRHRSSVVLAIYIRV